MNKGTPPLKNSGWKTTFVMTWPKLLGDMLVFGLKVNKGMLEDKNTGPEVQWNALRFLAGNDFQISNRTCIATFIKDVSAS